MAYTSVIPVRRLDRTVDYVQNKEKTTPKSLEEAVDYAANRDKTESACFETGLGCTTTGAFEDMRLNTLRWYKETGVQGYHLVQSFAEGEVTPELAHQIGVEFAEQLLHGKYQAIVTTHLNTKHLEIEGDIYRVCGLFRSSASLALCGESLDHGFSNIEFWGGYAAPPVETVQQLLRAAGIAQQVTLYFPFPWMAALTAYALCPAGLVLLAAARTLGGRVRRGCPKETCWFVLGGAFLLALVLPALLRLLPPWITPARWSDFSYWGGLLPAVGKAIETGFSLNPCAKDVLAKWNTLGLLIAATLANAAAGKLMLSRQQKNSTNL